MGKYCIKRLFSAVPVLLGISMIAFILGIITPGDPAMMALSRDGVSEVTEEQLEEKREELGLNDSVAVQYLRWLSNALRGDLGRSYADNTQVSGELLRRLPVTLKLSACSLILVILFGITGGILSAAKAGKVTDSCIKLITNLLLSFPAFWLAIILIIVFAENWKILPTNGVGGIRHMILPSITLSAATIGMTVRLMRSSMLTEFGKQYMLAANAKGISRIKVLFAHALPNAIIPVITLIGNYMGGILGGSFVVENIFSLPGIGSYVLEAIHSRDYPVIQGYVLVMGVTYVIVSLVIDLLCTLIQPKIRLGGKEL